MGALLDLLRGLVGRASATPPGVAGPVARPRMARSAADGGRTAYPGDFRGVPEMTYAARPDGRPDPGEIVWTWVPFEEDHTQGKDRPVLLIGRDGRWLLGLQLTSKDHDRDAEQEARAGRTWTDIGSGGWDRQGRPSEVRTNRVIRVDAGAVRREGAILSREVFEQVAAEVRRHAR
ncbi:MAG: type II toxin-antitoxin system PemK/MazF family toxin [Actinobacteria bacterium]|nr:type II toxin-antitoxin system PemK/MazF family toxin [Actinomycetota bacterium]